MKKIMIFAAFAALLSVASCQKEIVDNSSVESPIFTAIIDGGNTKTTVNLTNGKVSWESTDEITVKDAASATAIYKVASIDQSTGKATFVIKDGETALGAGPYSATYGSAPATNQTYSATNNNLYKGNLYMAAPETSSNSFTFSVACSLMKINLTKSGERVKSVAVTGIPTGGTKTTYTLTCASGVYISSGEDFSISLPAGTYDKIVVTNFSSVVCILDAKTPIVIESNHIKPVTLGENILHFDTLPGEFTVDPDGEPNSGDEKKIHFSKGNLVAKYQWTSDWSDKEWAWSFAETQYAIVGSGGNGNPENPNYGTTIDLFGWSTTNSNYGLKSAVQSGPWDENKPFEGNFVDWGIAYCTYNKLPAGTWRTLTKNEWSSLFGKQLQGANGSYSNSHVAKIGELASCLILLPDNWQWDTEEYSAIGTGWRNEYSESDWRAMEKAGAICFPSAGFRMKNTTDFDPGEKARCVGDYGYYWTSDVVYTYSYDWPYDEVLDQEMACNYQWNMSSWDCGQTSTFLRCSGESVRLVTETK